MDSPSLSKEDLQERGEAYAVEWDDLIESKVLGVRPGLTREEADGIFQHIRTLQVSKEWTELTCNNVIALMTKKRCNTCNAVNASWCSRCHSVAYCGRDCQVKDWKAHKKACPLLKRAHTDALYAKAPSVPIEVNRFPLPASVEVTSLLEGWDAYFSKRKIGNSSEIPEFESKDAFESFKHLLANSYSPALTILLAMQRFSLLPLPPSKSSVQIHIVGEDTVYADTQVQQLFLELPLLLALPVEILFFRDVVDEAVRGKKVVTDGRLTTSYHDEGYHVYCKDNVKKLQKRRPDIVVFFHTNFGSVPQMWLPSLYFVQMLELPAIFTSMTKGEHDRTVAALNKARSIVQYEGTNPFASQFYVQELWNRNEVFSANPYIIAVRGRRLTAAEAEKKAELEGGTSQC